MNYAIVQPDNSRAPTAFGLSVLLHLALVAALAAFILLHPVTKPVEKLSFELVAGPPSAGAGGGAPGPDSAITVPNMQSLMAPAPAPPSSPPVPTQSVEATPTPPSPAPVPDAAPTTKSAPPKSTTPVAPRGAQPRSSQAPKVMSLAEWQKLQQQRGRASAATASPTRGTGRPVPRVGVNVGGILNNLDKLAARGGTAGRGGVLTGPASGGEDGASDDYFARVVEQIRAAFVAPAAVDGLSATIRLVIAADGTVVSARLIQASPDARFNAAVNDALARLKNVGPPPDGEQLTKDFVFVPRGN